MATAFSLWKGWLNYRPFLKATAEMFCAEHEISFEQLTAKCKKKGLKQAFVIKYIADYSQSEMARFLGLHPSTVNYIVKKHNGRS